MAGERGSAALLVIMISMSMLLFQCQAVDYPVGGTSGWTTNMQTNPWAKGKPFKAGDILVFNYDPNVHNVVALGNNKNNYDNCKVPPGAKTYASGKDRIALKTGVNYFICSKLNHCTLGMKIAVTAK